MATERAFWDHMERHASVPFSASSDSHEDGAWRRVGRPRKVRRALGCVCPVALVVALSLAMLTPARATSSRIQWAVKDPVDEGWRGPPLVVSPTGERVFVYRDGPSPGTAVVAYDSLTGEESWRTDGQFSYRRAMAVSADGSKLFVTTGINVTTVVALDAATGAELWRTTTDGGPSTALAVSSDGTRVFAAMHAVGHLIALDATDGSEIWTSVVPFVSFDALVASSDDHRLFATGEGSDSGFPPRIVAVSQETGITLWSRVYSPFGGQSFPMGLAISPDGRRLYATIWDLRTGGDYPFALIAIDPKDGSSYWTSIHGGRPNAVVVSPQGNRVYVVGGGGQFLTTSFRASDGLLIWDHKVSWNTGPENIDNEWDEATAVASSPNGKRIYVAGLANSASWTTGPAYSDFGTVAYVAANGKTLWKEMFDGTSHGEDFASDVAASPDGNSVFVTGVSTSRSTSGSACQESSTACDLVTISYKAS